MSEKLPNSRELAENARKGVEDLVNYERAISHIRHVKLTRTPSHLFSLDKSSRIMPKA